MFTNIQVVERAKRLAGLAYKWNGDFNGKSDIVSPDNVAAWAKEFPGHYSPEKIKLLLDYYQGKLAGDCSGLVTSSIGLPKINSYDLWLMCDERHYFNRSIGLISQIPNIKGLIIWRKGHIGVYAGDGYVVESGSTRYGVTVTRIDQPQTGIKWTGYGYMRKHIEYTVTNGFQVIVTCTELNIRSTSTAKTRTNILGTFKRGKVVKISEVSGVWGKCEEGWINISGFFVKKV